MSYWPNRRADLADLPPKFTCKMISEDLARDGNEYRLRLENLPAMNSAMPSAAALLSLGDSIRPSSRIVRDDLVAALFEIGQTALRLEARGKGHWS